MYTCVFNMVLSVTHDSVTWEYPCHMTATQESVKPGVHTNDFATIHGRPVRIHTAPAEDNTSNQQSTPQALCEYGRGDRESWRNR